MRGSHQQQLSWAELNRRIEECRDCGRLVEHCRRVAREKRAAYRGCEYWGRPVGNFGDAAARLLVVGLAPGAHGANRTGRVFTGDSSGDWLFRALAKAGFANQPQATHRDDGLRLVDCAITGVLHCAPPDNMPSREERENCRPWLSRTIDLLPVKVFVALGGMAWQETVREVRARGWLSVRGRMVRGKETRAQPGRGQETRAEHVTRAQSARRVPKFAHGAKVSLAGGRWLLGCYHPSRQNTNTGRLTEPMLDAVFAEAQRLLAMSRN